MENVYKNMTKAGFSYSFTKRWKEKMLSSKITQEF